MNIFLRLSFCIILIMFTFFISPSFSQSSNVQDPESAPAVLKVLVSSFEPCVVTKEGKIEGFDIDLIRELCLKTGYKCQFIVMPFEKIFEAIHLKKADIAAAGLTITGSREKKIDFSHQYLQSGLKILVKNKENDKSNDFSSSRITRFRALKAFLSTLAAPGVIEFSFCLIIFVLFSAHIIWLAEKGEDAINDKYFPGIFEAIYFCFVTSSTVGYGDITPKKWLGKIVTLMLILTGIAFFANFTALLSADYTADRMDFSIKNPSDLKDRGVATKKGTISHDWLIKKKAIVRAYDDIDKAYESLLKDEVEAVVFDSPSVLHFANTKGRGKTTVIEGLFYPQYYGFAFQENSPLREKFNRALLESIEDGSYNQIKTKWLGK